MNFKKVTIVFPNYNGKMDTLATLESLVKLNYPKNEIEIIIVDNGSTDGSLKSISDYFNRIKGQNFANLELVKNQKNLGAPKAYNQGIEAAKLDFDYLWKLDNDVVVDPNSLFELEKVAEGNRNIGMVSGKIYYYGKRHSEAAKSAEESKSITIGSFGRLRLSQNNNYVIWAIGGKINYFFGNFRNVAKNQKDRRQYNTVSKNFDFLPGCALLVNKKVIQKIGLLDEKYFVYYDEVDWCVRAKKAGFDLAYQPKAIIWHKASRTTREGSFFKNYYLSRNKIYFLRKFKKSIIFPICFTIFFEIWHRWLFRSRLGDLPNILKGVGKGIIDGFQITNHEL